MGKPSPAFDVKILDENGATLPPGQEGDIAVQVLPERPFGLFTHYVVRALFLKYVSYLFLKSIVPASGIQKQRGHGFKIILSYYKASLRAGETLYHKYLVTTPIFIKQT